MSQSPAVPVTHSSISVLLNPSSVVVVGASQSDVRIGGMVLAFLRRFGFGGSVFAVNPKHVEVQGYPCFPSVSAIPSVAEIDLAIIFVPAASVAEVVEECGQRGIRAAVVISSGFAEVGVQGASLQERLVKVAQKYNMAMCGPNCAGIANTSTDFIAYGTSHFRRLSTYRKGGLALLTASGGFGNAMFGYCQSRGIGVSHLIGLGNEAVSTAADFLEALVEDPAVEIVGAYLEAIRDPIRFFAAADRAARVSKPVIVLMSGRSAVGRQSVATHTAALAGSARAHSGAFAKHGIIQVHDLDELADVIALLGHGTVVTGGRVGVFSLAGGGTSLVADIASDFGFEIPRLTSETTKDLVDVLPPIATVCNPLDTTAGFARDSAAHQKVLRRFAEDPLLDVVVHFPLASDPDYATSIAADLVAVGREMQKPLVCIWTAGEELQANAWQVLRDGRIPLFTSTTACFRALAQARTHAAHQIGLNDPARTDFGIHRGQTSIRADTASQLLFSFGIALLDSELATSLEAALAFADRVGWPVALKVASRDIAHKSDVGGVALGVRTREAATSAYERLIENARRLAPTAEIDGVYVQPMAPPGLEMLVGLTTDEQLGPTVSVGIGGVFAEVLDDVQQWPIPLSRFDVQAMLDRLRSREVLGEFRGQRVRDLPALIDVILNLSALAESVRERRIEVDLNPVIVGAEGEGVFIVDALVYVDGAVRHP
jgi:acetyltransferase